MRRGVRHLLTIITLLCTMFMTAGASWAYSISGTVSYSGSKTGRVYLSVYGQYGSTGYGTSISAPGAYTIRGLPSGDYTVKAFMDTIGFGVANALHPTGQSNPITVSGADLTGITVPLSDPNPDPALSLSAPHGVFVTPGDGEALVVWKGPTDSNGLEAAQSYNVYWSTSSNVLGTYTTSGGSRLGIPARDDGHQFVSGLSNGSQLYFAVTTLIGAAESAAAISSQVTINPPSGGTTVSGTVTLSGATATGPLFVGISPPNGAPVAFTLVPAPIGNPQAFTISGVQPGNYMVFAFIDNNVNGRIDLGDIHSPNNRERSITVSTSPLDIGAIAFSGANASVTTATTHSIYNGSDLYNLRFEASSLIKLPVTVVLNGGPNVTGPIDLGLSQWGNFQYDYYSNVPRPVVGQNYQFTIGYSDNSTPESVNSPVTGVLDDFAKQVSPKGVLSPPPPASVQFTWEQPFPVPGYPYTYNFWLNIPNGSFNSDPYNNMPGSTLSVTPGSGEFTAQTGLNYNWTVSLQDANRNSTQASTNFTYGSGSISGKVTSNGTNGIAGTYAVLIDPMSNSPLSGFPAIPTDIGSGAYTINNIPAGSYKLYFSAGPGYQSQFYNNQNNIGSAQWLNVTVDNPLAAIDAVLSPAPGTGTIAGTVVNASTHLPINNASIQLLDINNNMIGGVISVLTTSDGGFQISAINAGTYKLRISATDYQTSTPVTVYNVVSGQTTPVSINLPPIPATVTYTSKVTDSSSFAISGAQVELIAGNVTIAASTDVNGMFSISVPAQANLYLRISKAGYVTTTTSMMSFNKDTDTSDRPYSLQATADVTKWYTDAGVTPIPGTGTIAGRVASAANPLMTLPGVTLTASDGTGTPYTICYNNGTVNCSSMTSTNANGRFYILNVPAGKQVTVTATKTGYNIGSRSFLVAADSVSQGRIGISTSSSSFIMASKIVDTATIPAAVPGNTVMLFTDSGSTIGQLTTDTNGLFTAADLLAGTNYYLRFNGGTTYLDSYSGNMSIGANIDRTNRPYVMYPANQLTTWGFGTSNAVITGTVKDNMTGLPIVGATITATAGTILYDNGSGVPVSASGTSANGRFYVSGISAAAISTTVTITVTAANGYNLTNASRVYHVLNGKLTQGSIFLTPSTAPLSATGLASDRFNLPIAGAKVSAYALPGWTLLNNPALTDSNGKFSLTVQNNILFALEVLSSDYRSAYSQDLLLNQNSTLGNFILMSAADYGAMSWPLSPGSTFIRGMAVDTLGQPQSGVTLTASSTPTHTYTVQYVNDAYTLVTGSNTYTNGIFALTDAVSTDSNITLTASKAGKTFNNPSFSHLVPDTDSLGMAFEYSAISGTISSTPSSVNFGTVNLGSSAITQDVTITNSGPDTVTITLAGDTGNISELNIQPGGLNPCPSSLPAPFPTGSCTLIATFTPLSVGSKTTTLTINSNGSNPVFTLTLTGTVTATVPGAPVINSIVPWDGQATVNFTAPTFDGGSSILGYTVTTDPIAPILVSGTGNSRTISGLTNNQLYTIYVAAYNSVGTGSAASITTTPFFAPFRISTTGYADLISALSNVAANGEIKAHTGPVTLTPPLTLTQGVTISGGFNDNYSSISGYTTIPGRVNIRSTSNKVVFNNIRVK